MEKTIFEGMKSPWGKIQTIERLTPFLTKVTTASHGGLYVSKEENKKIPKIFRRASGWYEEDCEWSIPMYFLEKETIENYFKESFYYLKGVFEKRSHIKMIKECFWREYEIHFEDTLSEEESFSKSDYLWKSKNTKKWQVISVINTGNFVKITTTLGGKRNSGIEARDVLVRKEDYEKLVLNVGGRSDRIALDEAGLICISNEFYESFYI